MSYVIQKDGYTRRVWEDSVLWHIDNSRGEFGFVVARFPFVPDYHLCDFVDDDDDSYSEPCERPLQRFKTLTEALAVLRVLEASRPENL